MNNLKKQYDARIGFKINSNRLLMRLFCSNRTYLLFVEIELATAD